MNLKSYYNKLGSTTPRADFKKEVIEQCHISPKTFHNWMDNPSRIPEHAIEIINEIKTKKS